ncbi:hypothetical protein Ciccas_010649 [Cichlidogyrus casuarinus]|uniref:PinX1-related protein 1 n=1 Tax=Cichlidogyrus casuarinus TaxID=1844966 RepID=A0ABD2PTJ4_9PLAT
MTVWVNLVKLSLYPYHILLFFVFAFNIVLMTKFGEKILTNLGWQKGEGLGKNKHGILHPIRISLKNDNRGLGASVVKTQDSTTWNSIYENALNASVDSEVEKLFLKSNNHGKVSVKFLPSQHLYHNNMTVNTTENSTSKSEKRKHSSAPDVETAPECRPKKGKHSKVSDPEVPENEAIPDNPKLSKKHNQQENSDSAHNAAKRKHELKIDSNSSAPDVETSPEFRPKKRKHLKVFDPKFPENEPLSENPKLSKKKKQRENSESIDDAAKLENPSNSQSGPKKRKHSKVSDLEVPENEPIPDSLKHSKKNKGQEDSDSVYSAARLQIPSNTQSGLGMSDADLFEFCRGRTCHPAARFGNKLSGKLARVSKL